MLNRDTMLKWSSMFIPLLTSARAFRQAFAPAILFALCAALPIHAQMPQGDLADVILSGQRAYLFYFTHQAGPDNDPTLPHSASRTVIQVTELHWKEGTLTVDRNQPTHIRLDPGESNR